MLIYSCTQNKEKVELEAPLFEQMGDNHFKISTSSKLAQQFFDQGLVLAYGLNHAEALRSFEEAARLDPNCAMCYWGISYVLGPNINASMDKELLQQAVDAIHKAVSLIDGCTNKEKGMIWAMTKRYPEDETNDLTLYNSAYANAMKQIYNEHTSDPDVGCLYAEALMNEHPWNFWTKDGEPQAWTPNILKVLETILEKDPKHPGANHYYIHAIEASPFPEKGLKSANALRDLVPDAGHLLHMPSHIYIRTGNYHEGSLANERAARADSLYIANCKAQGVYPLAYYPHNYHFLAATATLEGRGAQAIKAAYQVAANTDTRLMAQPGWGTLQHYSTIPYFVLVKFGQWDKILGISKPDESLKYPLAIWHYAQGMAHLGKNDIKAGQRELSRIQEIEKDSSIYDIQIWDLNSVGAVVNMASLVLEGEIASSVGDHILAKKKLQEALDIEGTLTYTEPPDWFFSIRHALGAILMEGQWFTEAEKVYLDDLKLFPNNGWALKGLSESLIAQGKNEQAQVINKRFNKAMKYADLNIPASRLLSHQVKQYNNLEVGKPFGAENIALLSATTCNGQKAE